MSSKTLKKLRLLVSSADGYNISPGTFTISLPRPITGIVYEEWSFCSANAIVGVDMFSSENTSTSGLTYWRVVNSGLNGYYPPIADKTHSPRNLNNLKFSVSHLDGTPFDFATPFYIEIDLWCDC